jgi:Flp pilus assembly protein TadD
MFVPCEADYTYELKSGKSEESGKGIRSLRMDDYENAMQFFKAAMAKDPEDHRTVFAMGVTCELMKNGDEALKYYRQACGMPGLDEEDQAMYLAAKTRVADHKDRIRKAAKK